MADTLPAAFAEWSFTENTVNHKTPIETCELCGQHDLRYHFEIKLTQRMQLESCIVPWNSATKEINPVLSGALDYYRSNKKLTPKYAAVVFWKLRTFRIDHYPSFFQVELRRAQHVEDPRQMPTRPVHRFWSALSAGQRRKAVELGHTPPDE